MSTIDEKSPGERIAEAIQEARKNPPEEVAEAIAPWPIPLQERFAAMWHLGMDDAARIAREATS